MLRRCLALRNPPPHCALAPERPPFVRRLLDGMGLALRDDHGDPADGTDKLAVVLHLPHLRENRRQRPPGLSSDVANAAVSVPSHQALLDSSMVGQSQFLGCLLSSCEANQVDSDMLVHSGRVYDDSIYWMLACKYLDLH